MKFEDLWLGDASGTRKELDKIFGELNLKLGFVGAEASEEEDRVHLVA